MCKYLMYLHYRWTSNNASLSASASSSAITKKEYFFFFYTGAAFLREPKHSFDNARLMRGSQK